MNGLGWRLQRLRAMTPAELVHRTRVAVRDRWAPPRYAALAPDAAFGALFACAPTEALGASRLAALPHPSALTPADVAPVAAAAAALGAGRWTLFGAPVRLDDPPRWNVHPATGAAWPDGPSGAIDSRRIDVAGGAKYAWELGRLTVLPTLALAARAGGDGAAAERAARWLADWIARNPIDRGVHHTSGIENALRVTTVNWTLALLGDTAPPALVAPALGLLAQEALQCRDHLSLGSSANNHLIAEYAAMATMGALHPRLRDAEALLRDGQAGLERETLKQFHPDGVTAEQAFGYVPFIWELLLEAFVACEVAGRTIAPEVRARLAASLEFARVVRRPGGWMPQVGDEDDARVLLAVEDWPRLDLVGNALAAWLEGDALADGPHALARLVLGRDPRPARDAADGRHAFPAGGYTVWRARGVLATFDHGPLGLGPLAAHGHADALSVTLFRGDDAIAVDPGTYAYHEDPEARDRFRGTAWHNTITFGGRSQSAMRGPFLWGARAVVTAAGEDAFACAWPTGERHVRRVAFTGDGLSIDDDVRGVGAELTFVLAPGARIERDGVRAAVTIGSSRATFESTGADAWRIEPAEYSPRFGARVPTVRLVASIPGRTCRTHIALGPAG